MNAESDEVINNISSNYDFGSRIFDSRLGRWYSKDPYYRKFYDISPYAFVLNSPICLVDKDGNDVYWFDENNKLFAVIRDGRPNVAVRLTNFYYPIDNVIEFNQSNHDMFYISLSSSFLFGIERSITPASFPVGSTLVYFNRGDQTRGSVYLYSFEGHGFGFSTPAIMDFGVGDIHSPDSEINARDLSGKSFYSNNISISRGYSTDNDKPFGRKHIETKGILIPPTSIEVGVLYSKYKGQIGDEIEINEELQVKIDSYETNRTIDVFTPADVDEVTPWIFPIDNNVVITEEKQPLVLGSER